MKTIIQRSYAQPAYPQQYQEEPLVVHRRADVSRNRQLLIFVHGLGGKRYGARPTWGRLPEYLYEDFPGLDIGMYSYRTLTRRFNYFRSITVQDDAQIFADLLRHVSDAREYDSFILVGHSLGGLLAKGAIASLHERAFRSTLDRVGDLLLMATPQLGSLDVPRGLAWLSKDARVLRAHNKFVEKLITMFQSEFHCAVEPPVDDRPHIRTWALIAAADSWVDSVSANIGISETQRHLTNDTHTSIVKPKSKSADSYRFVQRVVETAVAPRARPIRNHIYRCAEYNELDTIRAFAEVSFNQQVSSLAVLQRWWGVEPEICYVVERVTTFPGKVSKAMIGYFCVLPVTEAAAERLRTGQLAIANASDADIAPRGKPVHTAYIGGIASVDNATSRGAVEAFFQAHLKGLAGRRDLRLLTRPVTIRGLELVNGFSFQPVDGNGGLGAIYEGKLVGKNPRATRKRVPRKPTPRAPLS